MRAVAAANTIKKSAQTIQSRPLTAWINKSDDIIEQGSAAGTDIPLVIVRINSSTRHTLRCVSVGLVTGPPLHGMQIRA